MDAPALLDAFDTQVRRRPTPEPPDGYIERDDDVIRTYGAGWTGVTWSDLHPATADTVIAAQIDRLTGRARPWEWKYYSYDQPPDLPERLTAAGLTAGPVEALLVAEIADLPLDVPPPPGVRLRPVTDRPDVEALICVHDEVFGTDHTAMGEALLAGLHQRPSTVAAVLALAGQTPTAAARLEFHPGTDFASLWGGGTLPDWRRRGVFRSLVAHRAAMAAAAGYRYLQVDASPDSRPILRRLGFVELATTIPFTHPGTAD
jgi:GNAT superfamily N-acetyltransferase